MVELISYYTGFALTALMIALAGFYAYAVRKKLCCKECEMHGMMLGMTFGMMAGLVTSTFIVIPTGDFFTGTIASSIVGLAVGFLVGRFFGGPLGRMEGVVAGPMGGMMGAMLGQMIRPFDLQIFVPFFMFLVAFIMFEISYVIFKTTKVNPGYLKALAGLLLLVTLGASFFLNFSLQGSSITSNVTLASSDGASSKYKWLSNYGEKKETATLNGDVQEVTINATFSNYEPNVIVAKKGVPLKITLTADQDASCGRDIVFPEFNQRTLIPKGESTTLTLDLDKTGEFAFHCAMDMLQGKIIVQE